MTFVMVWNNNMVSRGHTYPGHSSLLIGMNWAEPSSYVSWVPADNNEMRGGKSETIFYDLSLEGYAPDHILFLPGKMDERAMRAEWSLIKGKENAHYRMYRKNCSNIVARVMRAGTKAGSPKDRHSLIWTPLQIKRFALAIGGEKRAWSYLLGALKAAGQINQGEFDMLSNLGKRDEKHGKGSTGNFSYHSKGKKIGAPQPVMVSPGRKLSTGETFGIGYDPANRGNVQQAVFGGSLYTGADMWDIEDQLIQQALARVDE